MKIDSTNIIENVESVFNSSKKIIEMIAKSKENLSALEKNSVHFEILDTLQKIKNIMDVFCGDLKRIERLHDVLSEMITYYPYNSQDLGKE